MSFTPPIWEPLPSLGAPWQYSLYWPTNDWRAASEVPKPKVGRQKDPRSQKPDWAALIQRMKRSNNPWLPKTTKKKKCHLCIHPIHPIRSRSFSTPWRPLCRLPKLGPNWKLSKIRNWTRTSPTPPSSCQGFSCFFFPVASGMEMAKSQLEIWDSRNELTLQIG